MTPDLRRRRPSASASAITLTLTLTLTLTGALGLGACVRPTAAPPTQAPLTVPPSFDVEGHRGDRGNVPPGNTTPSFASALALGVDTLEADMQISADGQVFMGHDDDLAKTGCAWAGVGGQVLPKSARISKLSAAQVAGFDCHPEIEGVQAPPRLDEFLDQAGPEIQLNLELKARSKAAADIYLEALITYQEDCGGCLSGRVILQSFKWSALRYARAEYGDALEFRAAILDKRGWVGAIARARAYAEIWSPKHGLVDAGRLERVRALDMLTIPWTVNDEARMRELIELGVDGMITDYPDRLLQLVGRTAP